MPDLMCRGETNARDRLPHHRNAGSAEISLDLTVETSTDTLICVCGRRSSAAC